MISSLRRQLHLSLFLIFSVGGFFVLAWSGFDWFELMSGQRMEASFCTISSYWNCDRATLSPMGSIGGIPVGILGAGWFLVIGILGLMGDRVLNFRRFLLGIGVAAAFLMAGYLFFVLKSGCIICMVSYLCILGAVYFGWNFKDRLLQPTQSIVVIVLGLSALGAYSLYRKSGLDGKIPVQEIPLYWQSLPVQQIAVQSPLTFGPQNAQVVVLEFSDFGCPYCGLAAETMLPFLKTHADVQIQFFPFPLDAECNPAVQRTAHPGACRWSKIALCAQEQNKLWEVHDFVFMRARRDGELPDVEASVKNLGLDAEKLKACMEKAEIDSQLRALIEAANKLGVNSTPTFVINGRIVKGYLPIPFLRHLLKEARK